MRFRRLDLSRYGRFTDFSIDFGERDVSQADFHLIYGPNEAGKSTMLAAILDFLFGIERQSPYNFRHDYSVMQIGAHIEVAGTPHELVRIKRDKDSLRGLDNRPVPEAVLTACLGSIDRQGYRTMFSLDDDTLQDGGESILQSRGEIGRLLFSATSGLSDFSLALDQIKQEVDGLFRRNAKTTAFRDLKDRLDDLTREKTKLDVLAKRFVELDETASQACARLDEARISRDDILKRKARIEALLGAERVWRKLQSLRLQREPLRALPEPKAGWAEEAKKLQEKRIEGEANVRSAKIGIKRLEDDLASLVEDKVILDLQPAIDGLAEAQGDSNSVDDLADLEAKRHGVEVELLDLCRRLGRSDIENLDELILMPTVTGPIKKLTEAQSALRARLDVASDEAEEAAFGLDQARTALAALDEFPDIQAVEAATVRLRGQAVEADRRHLEAQRDKLSIEIDRVLEKLRPWQGDLDTLATLDLPEGGRVARWKVDLDRCRDDEDRHRRRVEEEEMKRRQITTEIGRLKSLIDAVEDLDSRAARAAREEAWATHRSLLGGGRGGETTLDAAALHTTADRFEAAMKQDDRIRVWRDRHVAERQRLQALTENLAVNDEELTALRQHVATVQGTKEAVIASVAKAARPLGLPGDIEPVDLDRWREHRDKAIALHADLRDLDVEIDAIERRRQTASAELSAVLEIVGMEVAGAAGLDQLLDMAQSVLDHARDADNKINVASDRVKEAEQAFRERERRLEVIRKAEQDWDAEWSEVVCKSWLGEIDPLPKPEQVAGILPVLDEIRPRKAKHEELSHRILARQEQRARFIDQVQALAARSGKPFEDDQATEIARQLRRRLDDAKEEQVKCRTKQEQRQHCQQQLQQTLHEIVDIDARVTQMAARFDRVGLGVDDLIEKIDQAAFKADLLQEIVGIEEQLLQMLKATSLETAEQEIEAALAPDNALAALQADGIALDGQLEECNKLFEQRIREHQMAEQAIEAIGSDGDVARIEEQRRTLLLEIEELAFLYLRLRIGAMAADDALGIYRDRHRSSMMSRASDAFATMTDGSFTSLTTTPGKEGDLLVGMRHDGGSLIASDMSKGTRFQLYLALRIAGFCEFVRHREALPFIADDILETFDDDRSANAFRLLHELSGQGQVIYLTHHKHLCDIAKDVLGESVTVHELFPQTASVKNKDLAA